MEKLNKNNPRFCAQYVEEVGIAKEQKIGWCRAFKIEGKFFIYQRINQDHKVGDIVFIAKKIPLPGREWKIHKVKLGEEYWGYEYFMGKTAKDQRIAPYTPRTQSWFHGSTMVVEEVSIEYIKRNFSY